MSRDADRQKGGAGEEASALPAITAALPGDCPAACWSYGMPDAGGEPAADHLPALPDDPIGKVLDVHGAGGALSVGEVAELLAFSGECGAGHAAGFAWVTTSFPPTADLYESDEEQEAEVVAEAEPKGHSLEPLLDDLLARDWSTPAAVAAATSGWLDRWLRGGKAAAEHGLCVRAASAVGLRATPAAAAAPAAAPATAPAPARVNTILAVRKRKPEAPAAATADQPGARPRSAAPRPHRPQCTTNTSPSSPRGANAFAASLSTGRSG
jgi:hypothetical protein